MRDHSFNTNRKKLTMNSPDKKWSPESLQKLSDNDFIERFCIATEDRTNLDFKVFLHENKKKNGAPRAAIDDCLREAERRQIPLKTIADCLVKRALAGSSFISNMLAPKTWRRYEIHAAAAILKLLEAQGIKLDSIEYDAKTIGKITKSERQVDLLIKKETPRKHYVACEIKNFESGKVAVEKVEAFATKMKDIGVEYGAMIAPEGFQQSSISTAKHYNISLFTLKEVVGRDVPPELKSLGTIDEVKFYWILRHEEHQWLLDGQLTENKRNSS